jgi:hypothetical protein
MRNQCQINRAFTAIHILGRVEHRGFDAQADLDLVHQDLDPAAEFIDRFGLARCCGFGAIEPAQKFVEVGQVGALLSEVSDRHTSLMWSSLDRMSAS